MVNIAERVPLADVVAVVVKKPDGPLVVHRKSPKFLTSLAVIARAREELQELTGYRIDSVSGFSKTEEGWRLAVTVVELRRIPAATDVLAVYDVILNPSGDVINYQRVSRYFRAQVGQGE